MRLLFYNPPSSAQRKPVLPMSLLALGAVLEGKHDYAIVDGNLEPDPLGRLDRLVRESGVEVLGVTVMPGPQLCNAVPLCRQLKKMHPRLQIVWGGYFPSQHYDVCLRADYVDYVVRGHGEFVFLQLLERLSRGQGVDDLPGLAYRHPQSGKIITNPMAAIPNPDELPDFPYQRVEVERYIRRTFLGRRTLAHHSSYGCPFYCNFCAVVNMVDGRWLAQSAARTAEVVRKLVSSWNIDAVEFYDNNFFTHEARTQEFSERIQGLGISWWGEARIDTLMKYANSTWQRMARSGLKMVFLGAESGSDETLERMNKGGTASADKTLAIAEKMKTYGIVPEFSFVLGNPPNPEADTAETIEFIRKVKKINPQAEIVLYMYTPVPLAGALYEQAKATGFQFPQTLEEWIRPHWLEFCQRRSTSLPWLQDPLRRRVRDFERVLNAYYPTATDARLTELWRWVLRIASAARYRLRFYRYPIELRALHRIVAYQRPETSGF
jgi:tRNA A37 methylthiotransferase MiaB